MVTKRKTHLNLSGSHHTLDSDDGFVGGTLYITGALSASTNVSAQGNLFVQGTSQQTGSAFFGNVVSASNGFRAGASSIFKNGTFDGTVSASSNISTATSLQVGQNAFVTGSLQVTGSIFAQNAVSASQGIFTQLTGSLSGTTAGLPFLISGGNLNGVNYIPSTGQWAITGSSAGSVAGSDTQVQFNQNGAFAASSSFTFLSGTLKVPTISGSNASTPLSGFGIAEALLINSNVAVTKSVVLFDGVDDFLTSGGPSVANGASIKVFSGSASPTAPFSINRASTLNSGSGKVDVVFDNLINIRPLHVTMSTTSNSGILLSGSLITNHLTGATIAKVDFSVLAIQQASDNFASWTFSTTTRSDLADTRSVLAATELDAVFEGANAATWDVNINSDGNIYCTGSNHTVHWYAQVIKKMALSGSSTVLY